MALLPDGSNRGHWPYLVDRIKDSSCASAKRQLLETASYSPIEREGATGKLDRHLHASDSVDPSRAELLSR